MGWGLRVNWEQWLFIADGKHFSILTGNKPVSMHTHRLSVWWPSPADPSPPTPLMPYLSKFPVHLRVPAVSPHLMQGFPWAGLRMSSATRNGLPEAWIEEWVLGVLQNHSPSPYPHCTLWPGSVLTALSINCTPFVPATGVVISITHFIQEETETLKSEDNGLITSHDIIIYQKGSKIWTSDKTKTNLDKNIGKKSLSLDLPKYC